LQPGVRDPQGVRGGTAGGPRHEPMLISSPLTFFIFISITGHIDIFIYTDKYYRQNMCAGGGGVAAVTNMKKKGTGLKKSVGHGLLSGQNRGPWDKNR